MLRAADGVPRQALSSYCSLLPELCTAGLGEFLYRDQPCRILQKIRASACKRLASSLQRVREAILSGRCSAVGSMTALEDTAFSPLFWLA